MRRSCLLHSLLHCLCVFQELDYYMINLYDDEGIKWFQSICILSGISPRIWLKLWFEDECPLRLPMCSRVWQQIKVEADGAMTRKIISLLNRICDKRTFQYNITWKLLVRISNHNFKHFAHTDFICLQEPFKQSKGLGIKLCLFVLIFVIKWLRCLFWIIMFDIWKF